MEHFLPSVQALKSLLFSGFHKECVMLTNDAIYKLTQMYAGRGGAFNITRIIPTVKTIFCDYLDVCYWAYRALLNTNESHHPDAQNYIAACEFIGIYLQKSGRYDPFIFEKIHMSVTPKNPHKVYNVYLSCLWTNTASLYKDWNTLFDDVALNNTTNLGHASNDITFVLTENKNDADYFGVIWGSREKYTDEQLSRTIFFRTEPVFPEKIMLGQEYKSEPLKFMKYYDYADLRYPNCMENWLQTKPNKLLSSTPDKPDSFTHCISSVVSNKYIDPGHRYRIDLLRYMISNIQELHTIIDKEGTAPLDKSNILHIYGFDNTLQFPDEYYYGPLPERNKSMLMKYRYTLIAENHSIPGYITEKIADGILSECLVFYWGCPNIERYYPAVHGVLPYVVLPMDDVDASFGIIKLALINDWWSLKLAAIRATKKLILTKMMMQHRISQAIHEDVGRKVLGQDALHILRLATSTDCLGNGIFSTIYYTGNRYESLKQYVEVHAPQVSLKMLEGLSESVPNSPNTMLVQEFSNKNVTGMQQYTIGFTRFSVRDVSYEKTLPKAFVINLDRRSDRLSEFDKKFPSKEWGYTRFNAFDGNKLQNNGEYSQFIQHLFRNNDFCSRASVIGCAMSHIKLWQTLVSDNLHNSYVIYEDDVEFTENYTWKLFGLLQQLSFDWDILFLGHLMCYELQTTHRRESDEIPQWESMIKYIVPHRTSWIGTASYIISKRGASKLLEYIDKQGVQHGIDYLIQLQFNTLLRAYGVNPMINFAEYESPLNPKINIDSDIQK